jgi:hypothetical protein
MYERKREKIRESYRKLRNKKIGNWRFSSQSIRVSNPGVFGLAVREAHEEESGSIHRRFVGMPEGKRPLWRPRGRCDDIFK